MTGPQFIKNVESANYQVDRYNYVYLSLDVELGGEAESLTIEEIDLSLVVSEYFQATETLESTIDLDLFMWTGDDLPSYWATNEIGLHLDFSKGEYIYNLILVWDPWESPLLTGKNYTYIVHVALNGVDSEVDVEVRFEGSLVTTKTTNATGFMEYWAIVGSPGLHTWTYSIYDEGVNTAVIYKDVTYVDGGPGPDPDDPPGPGPILWDLPTEPGSMFGILDLLPAMVVFGFFGFGGMLMMGRMGLMFGAVGAFFVLTAMGTLPTWILYFAILIAILIVVFKLKSGGSNVTVEGGNGA